MQQEPPTDLETFQLTTTGLLGKRVTVGVKILPWAVFLLGTSGCAQEEGRCGRLVKEVSLQEQHELPRIPKQRAELLSWESCLQPPIPPSPQENCLLFEPLLGFLETTLTYS